MSRTFIKKLAAAARVLARLRAELAEAQQYLVPAGLLVLASSGTAMAQSVSPAADERPALEARVRALEAELAIALARLREIVPASEPAAPAASSVSLAAVAPGSNEPAVTPSDLAGVEDRLEALDQQIRVVQRLAEIEREKADAEIKAAPRVTAGSEGFALTSGDRQFQIKFRGYTQADGRFYTSGRAAGTADTFTMRRVRPILEGTLFGNFGFRVMPDFGEGRTSLQDAYAELRFTPTLLLRAGKFKSPFGLERLASATDLLFVDRALPTALVPNRDVGVMLSGDVAAATVSYAVGVFNGVADGASADFDDSRGKDVVGRVFLQPFSGSRDSPFQQLGFGLAASIGEREGSAAAPGLPTFRTTSQQTFARFRTDGVNTAIADGRHWRLSPQGQFSLGSFGALTEFVLSSQQVRQNAVVGTASNRAWQLATSFNLTGEAAGPRLAPRRAFDPKSGAWGAFQVTARYHTLELDDDFLTRWATPATGVRWARAWDTGLNWYLNRAVKLSAEYQETRFKGGAEGGDRPTERGVLTRVQVGF